jgi:hypothetical protein
VVLSQEEKYQPGRNQTLKLYDNIKMRSRELGNININQTNFQGGHIEEQRRISLISVLGRACTLKITITSIIKFKWKTIKYQETLFNMTLEITCRLYIPEKF